MFFLRCCFTFFSNFRSRKTTSCCSLCTSRFPFFHTSEGNHVSFPAAVATAAATFASKHNQLFDVVGALLPEAKKNPKQRNTKFSPPIPVAHTPRPAKWGTYLYFPTVFKTFALLISQNWFCCWPCLVFCYYYRTSTFIFKVSRYLFSTRRDIIGISKTENKSPSSANQPASQPACMHPLARSM